MRRYLRNPRVLAGAALVLLLLLVALWPDSVAVDVAEVRQGTLRVTVDEEGETRVRERFVLSAPVSGRVLRVELEPGDVVARGAVLATLRPADPVPLDARSRAEAQSAAAAADAAVGSARAERERAESALGLARSEAARQGELARQQIASSQQVEAAQAGLRSAEEALRAAEFALRAAEHQRQMARVRVSPPVGGGATIALRSPVDGVVLRRIRESEAVVAAGEPLLEVGDPRDLEIVSDLLSSDAVKVRAGLPVLVEQWGGEGALAGRVRRVEPSGFMKVSALGVEEQRVNVVIDLDDDAVAARLGDGYRVEVRIVVWEGRDVLVAPTAALFRRGEEWAVFVAEEGRARLRPVEIGRRNGLEAEVVSGLAEGARVVVHPGDSVTDGVRIAVRAS